MPSFINYRPGELPDLVRNYVRAERVNDILANQTSRRYLDYFTYMADQFAGRETGYKERPKLPERAIEAYEKREDKFVEVCRFYRHQDTEHRICATPHAIDGDFGITFRVRKTLAEYDREDGVDPPIYNHCQAMMLVTGLPEWAVCDAYFDGEISKLGRLRRVWFDTVQAREIEREMIAFLFKTQRRAVA